MRFALILEELGRREQVKCAISELVKESFQYSEKSLDRIKRGQIHALVAKKLGLPLNNKLCLQVRDAVLALGCQKYISRGDLYYQYIQRRGRHVD